MYKPVYYVLNGATSVPRQDICDKLEELVDNDFVVITGQDIFGDEKGKKKKKSDKGSHLYIISCMLVYVLMLFVTIFKLVIKRAKKVNKR